MKSIRAKALITLLVISLTLCASNLREESKTYSQSEVEAAVKNNEGATTTGWEGGSWDKGFQCPELSIVPNGIQPPQVIGPCTIDGAKLMKNDGYNTIGFPVVFKDKPKGGTWIFSICQPEADGKTFVLPWRYIVSSTFTDHFAGNKVLAIELRNDKNDTYDLKIKLPFKYIGNYISVEEGNKIRARINEKAMEIRDDIKKNKDQIVINYAEYKQLYTNQFRIKEGAKMIQKQIDGNIAKSQEIDKQIIAQEIKINKIKAEYQTFLSEAAAHRQQIHKLGADIINNNVLIKGLSESITNLKASKTNPVNEQNKATNEKVALDKQANKHFDNLVKLVPGKSKIIALARAKFLQPNKEFIGELNKYYPSN